HNLETIANDAVVFKQLLNPTPAIPGDLCRIESVERRAIIVALAQDRVPAQPCLCTLENQEFEQHAIIVLRHTPFFVVVAHRKFIARPTAADKEPPCVPTPSPRPYSSDFGSELFLGEYLFNSAIRSWAAPGVLTLPLRKMSFTLISCPYSLRFARLSGRSVDPSRDTPANSPRERE